MESLIMCILYIYCSVLRNLFYNNGQISFFNGGSRIDGRGVLRLFKTSACEILCATPTFDIISAHMTW